MPEIVFDEAKHQYKVDGKVMPSVTQIIGDVLKGEREEQEPSTAMNKGTIIHKSLEYLDKSIFGDYDQRLQPYIDAWNKFKNEHNVKITEIEKMLYSSLGFCGTIDRIATVDGKPYVIDIKSGKSYKEYPLQTMGYLKLVDIAPFTTQRMCVYFEGSNYIIEEHNNPEDEKTFMALLQVWKWKKNKL